MTHYNIEMLRGAVVNLGALTKELVFVGGATTGLFITDEGTAEIRTTKDVDAIVEAASYAQYSFFSERLKNAGFREDTSDGAPLCRWVKEDIVLDVMPLDEETLGFTNRWYKAAMETAEEREIAPELAIKVVSPPYFCATKMEAFEGRGKGDYLASHDLEDIITVIDGRGEIVAEIQQAPDDVRSFIAGKVSEWLKTDKFLDALPGHLGGNERLGLVLERLKQIADFTEN